MKTKILTNLPLVTFAALLCAPPPAPAQSILGSSGNFTILAGSAITNNGNTIITGNIGVSPGTAISSFPPGIVTGTIHNNDTASAKGKADLQKAFDGLAGLPSTVNLSNTNLGGLTLAPGVYKFDGAATLTGALILDAQGKNNVSWVFQIATALTSSSTSSVQIINLGTNNGQDDGVFWQAGSGVTIGAGSTIEGNYLAGTSITFGGTVSGTGRGLAFAGVTLNDNQITADGPNGDLTGGLQLATNGNIVTTEPLQIQVDDASQRIWDLSGTYAFNLPNFTVNTTIVLGANGGYTGAATVTGHTGSGNITSDGVFTGVVQQSGSVAWVVSNIHSRTVFSVNANLVPNSTPGLVHGVLTSAFTTRLGINQNSLTLDGNVTGTASIAAPKQATLAHAYLLRNTGHNAVSVPLAAGMDGTWTLNLALSKTLTRYKGDGTITLSNGKTFDVKATGNYVARTGVLTLSVTGNNGVRGLTVTFQLNWNPETSTVTSVKSLHVLFLGHHVS